MAEPATQYSQIGTNDATTAEVRLKARQDL